MCCSAATNSVSIEAEVACNEGQQHASGLGQQHGSALGLLGAVFQIEALLFFVKGTMPTHNQSGGNGLLYIFFLLQEPVLSI